MDCFVAALLAMTAASQATRRRLLTRIASQFGLCPQAGRGDLELSLRANLSLCPPSLSLEPRHQLDMRGVAELVDRRHAFDAIAAVDQNSRVARECRDVA